MLSKIYKSCFFSIVFLLVVLIFHVVVSFFFPRKALFNYGVYLNDESGEIKESFEFLGCGVWDVYRDSELTEYISNRGSLNKREGEWRTVSRVPWLVSSYAPVYYYQSSIGQIDELAELWDLNNYSEFSKKESAEIVIKLLQKEDAPSAIDLYIDSLAGD